VNNKQPKLVVRACILCKEYDFWCFIEETTELGILLREEPEDGAKLYIYDKCNITSCSELATNPKAQTKFRELDGKYKDW